MKGLKVFIVITVITILLVAFAFMMLYLGWIGNINNPLSKPDEVQTLTGILGLAIGTAAALGSAIAALKVASLGLEISQQQERRDNVEFVESKVEKSINIFSEIALVLGKIHSSAIAVDAKIPHIPNEEINLYMEKEVGPDLEVEMIQLADNILLLADLFQEVIKNDFATSCYFQALKTFNTKCGFMNHQLKSIDPDSTNHSIYTLNPENISDITSILDLGQRRIRRGKLGELISAKLYTNSADTKIFNVPYDNANVRSFFFLGNLILSVQSTDDVYFIANYGAAILHDIFYSIPDGKIFETVLRERYSNLFTLNKNYKVSFEPKRITSKYLQKALEDADGIGDLYLLVNKS